MKNRIVRKSNFLIEASYKLTTIEHKIILTLAASLNTEDKDFKKYSFRVKNLVSLLGLSNPNEYKHLSKITENLLKKVLVLKTEDETLQTHWLSSAKYIKGEGIVELKFDSEIKPFLLELKKRFTNYPLRYALRLRSQFSIRIYELLKQYEKLGNRLFEVSELRTILGIGEDQYRQYTDFKKRVILVAQAELVEKTDISFEFEELKMGHSVGQIRFFIKTKPLEVAQIMAAEAFPAIPILQENGDLEKLMALLPKDYQGKDSVRKMLKTWLEKQNFDYVARNIEYANDGSNAVKPGISLGKGSNYRVYLSKALTGDFGLPHKEDKETKKKAEAEAKRKAQEEAHTQKQKQEQVDLEKENLERARTFQQSLSIEAMENLKAEAFSRLPPEQQTLVKRKATGSEMTLKFMMNKISLERMKVS